jgi:5-methylcytosine-specific restriction endonuclease McrA
MNISDKRLRKVVFDKYDGKCAYCGVDLKILHIDHIEPKRRHLALTKPHLMGKDNIDNFNPCCASCNSSKGSQTIEEFRNQIENRHNYMMKYSSEYRSMVKFQRLIINEEPLLFHFEKLKQ